MSDRTVDELIEAALLSLSEGQRDVAYSLAQGALAASGSTIERIVSATTVISMAWLARRNPLRAEGSISHALLLLPRERWAHLGFPAIEVVDAVAEDPEAPEGPSPTAGLAIETAYLLNGPQGGEMRAHWFTFIALYVPVMLRNGLPRRAAAAARRAWRTIVETCDTTDENRATILRWWAESERALAADGYASRLGEVEASLARELASMPSSVSPTRFELARLAADTAFLARRAPAHVSALLETAWSLASSPASRIAVLARRGALAVRHPAQVRPFVELSSSIAPASVDIASAEDAVLVARAAVTLGRLGMAQGWLSALECCLASPDRSLNIDVKTLRAELHLARGALADALPLASECFTALEAAVSEDAHDPHVGESIGRLAYILTRCHVDSSYSAALPAERDAEAARALIALEQARALRVSWSAQREDRRAEHGAIGLPNDERAARLTRDLRLEKGTIACAFLWDNRRMRLGVFVVKGSAPLQFHWLRVPSGCADLVAAARITSALGRHERLEEFRRALAELTAVSSRILHAPFDDAPQASLQSMLAHERPGRIRIVPHGPVIGLPLHIPLLRSAPEDAPLPAVSFAPSLFMRHKDGPPSAGRQEQRCAVVCGHPEKWAEAERLALCLKKTGRKVRMSTAVNLAMSLRTSRAVEVLFVAHGIAVDEARRETPWRAERARPCGPCIDLGDAKITADEVLATRNLPWGALFLCVCSGARHIDPIEVVDADMPSWQLAFLDDPTAGITGAFLTSGVKHVIAFPFPVQSGAAVDFFAALFEARAMEATGDRDIDWARLVVETQEGLGVRTESHDLLGLAAQHWSWARGE